MPEKRNKGLFDFASEHPYITMFIIGDLAAMVANTFGYIFGGKKCEKPLDSPIKIEVTPNAKPVQKET